jgi:hypothetical protein
MSRFLRQLWRYKDSFENEAWLARTAWKMEAWRERAEQLRLDEAILEKASKGVINLPTGKVGEGLIIEGLVAREELPPARPVGADPPSGGDPLEYATIDVLPAAHAVSLRPFFRVASRYNPAPPAIADRLTQTLPIGRKGAPRRSVAPASQPSRREVEEARNWS